MPILTVEDLRQAFKELPGEEPVKVVLSLTHARKEQMVEDGEVLTVESAGRYVKGFRLIVATVEE